MFFCGCYIVGNVFGCVVGNIQCYFSRVVRQVDSCIIIVLGKKGYGFCMCLYVSGFRSYVYIVFC